MLYWNAQRLSRRTGGVVINLQQGQGPKNTQTGRLDRRTLLMKRYMILRTIGQGGMGAVYKAQDVKRQTICAIKEMSLSMVPPEERARAVENFKAEAQMLANLKHPNLPAVTGYFTEGSRHFLVMEYIEGITLEEYLERNAAPFSERRVLTWAKQLCDVLSYLHSQHPPIIFRDMKPGNIMLMRNNRVKLIDFGIARFFRDTSKQDTQLLGTPGFAPPEQYGKAQTDERSDIYSLAMTLFQLLTNTLSEKGFGLQDIQQINPDISLPVARALEKAAALSADDRFQSVDAFRRALLGEGTFMFEDGDQATTVEELAELCMRFPEEAADYLFAGEIEGWLQENNHPELALEAQRIRSEQEDPESAVELLLQALLGPHAQIRRITGKSPSLSKSSQAGIPAVSASIYTATSSRKGPFVEPVRNSAEDLLVQPLTLDFGDVEPGLSEPMVLSISGLGGAKVRGTLSTNEAWIQLDQHHFQGANTRVKVQVDTTRLRGSTHYGGAIIVIPDEDDETQDIVVSVAVDVPGRVNGVPGRPLNGPQAPDSSDLDAFTEDDEEDDLVAPANGMQMAPRTSANPAQSSAYNSPRYDEHRAKYGQPGSWDPLQASALQRHLLQHSLTVFAAFMLASFFYSVLARMPFLNGKAPLPPNVWFIVVLVGIVPSATLGALLVNWKSTWTLRESINRLCTGLSGTLLVVGFTNFIWQTIAHFSVPVLQLFVMLLVAAVAASVGTYPLVSEKIIAGVVWAMFYVRWLVISIAVLIGGIMGYILTVGFALTCFTPFGILTGSGIAIALTLWVDHLIKKPY